jgi:hypothetical protein
MRLTLESRLGQVCNKSYFKVQTRKSTMRFILQLDLRLRKKGKEVIQSCIG